MEKRTIGSFIAVLRKANGMTQKELGDKLFVSDKTVSRWERDECAPDLSLIPAIADLFGVTADELLRGAKSNPDTPSQESGEKEQEKRERQYRPLLRVQKQRFTNTLWISYGLSLLGLLAAFLCNFGFTRGNIGFAVGMTFWLAGGIVALCACNRYYLRREDERFCRDAPHTSFWSSLGYCCPFCSALPIAGLPPTCGREWEFCAGLCCGLRESLYMRSF